MTPALLECLDAAYRIRRERGSASLADVAERLGTGEAQATERVLGLAGMGLVQRDPEDGVVVTPAGERIAIRLIRKHRLLERFLTDTLGLPWARVHEDACRLTPVLSDDAAEALARLLGQPATCPHGNVIPSGVECLPAGAAVPLPRLRPGQTATIERIEREEPEVLRYLAALGLLPATTVEVEEQGPFGGPVLVRVGDSRYALGRDVAAHIVVRPLP
jgi:DtxR family transcriptional regulator, Mn-dependent transcriptional regulator